MIPAQVNKELSVVRSLTPDPEMDAGAGKTETEALNTKTGKVNNSGNLQGKL